MNVHKDVRVNDLTPIARVRLNDLEPQEALAPAKVALRGNLFHVANHTVDAITSKWARLHGQREPVPVDGFGLKLLVDELLCSDLDALLEPTDTHVDLFACLEQGLDLLEILGDPWVIGASGHLVSHGA